LRRLAVLFAFGLAHALLVWSGDVLHHYAVLGLALLALRKVPRRWLFALIVAAFLVPQGVRLYRTATSTPEARAEREAFVVQMRARANAAYAGGSYVEAVKVRAAETKSLTVGRPLEGLNWLMSLTVTILLGLHFGRERLIERAAELGPFWARLQRWSLALGLGSGLLAAACGWNLRPGQPTMLGFASGLFFELSRPTLMLFYASTIVRFCVRRPHAPWLATVAAAGRMPLTNYLMQSVLCTLIFYGYGLGLYGKTPPLTFLAIAAAVWGLEVVWSRWWLRHFLFGPAEWLWRTLSYGAWLPARRRVPAGAE
ncbi:MAG TPA: DUF418 domain-containing protein, partial [Polyangiaceae bacterium]|nr:DUF418 domain-containing protein [Polyangiaceae bacterium]